MGNPPSPISGGFIYQAPTQGAWERAIRPRVVRKGEPGREPHLAIREFVCFDRKYVFRAFFGIGEKGTKGPPDNIEPTDSRNPDSWKLFNNMDSRQKEKKI